LLWLGGAGALALIFINFNIPPCIDADRPEDLLICTCGVVLCWNVQASQSLGNSPPAAIKYPLTTATMQRISRNKQNKSTGANRSQHHSSWLGQLFVLSAIVASGAAADGTEERAGVSSFGYHFGSLFPRAAAAHSEQETEPTSSSTSFQRATADTADQTYNRRATTITLRTGGQQFSPRKRSSRITINFGSQSTYDHTLTSPSDADLGLTSEDENYYADFTQSQQRQDPDNLTRITQNTHKLDDGGEVIVNLDANCLQRFLASLPTLIGATIGTTFATFRIVALLIAGRRMLNVLGFIFKDIILNLPIDYLTGYYLRKTFTRLERAYLRYYELPSALRAIARTGSQVCISFLVASVIGWVYAMGDPPCRESDQGLSMICSVLWIAAVVAAGRACASAVAVWGGPLRVEVATHPKNKKVFTRPSHFVEWITNVDEVKNLLSHDGVKAFDPNPLIFPATWLPFKILLIFAVAKSLEVGPSGCDWCSTESPNLPRLMKLYLVQAALGEEWHRVLLIEKRVGLGIVAVSAYFLALANLVFVTTKVSGFAASFMIPSLAAVIISGWMNAVIYITRQDLDEKEAAAKALERRKQAALGTFKLGDSYYN